jgi:hypothetical protein
MGRYRLCFIDGSNACKRVMEFDCEGDKAAFLLTETFRGECALELWRGDQCIAKVGKLAEVDGRTSWKFD